jgi:hypothetical protein
MINEFRRERRDRVNSVSNMEWDTRKGKKPSG